MLHPRTGRLIALACLLALGMLLATLHNRAVEQEQPFAISRIIRAVLSPFQSSIHSVVRTGQGFKESVRSRKVLQQQNRMLRQEVLNLTRENAELREARAENERLRESLGFKKRYRGDLIAAQVISRGSSRWHDTITIDRGSRDGLQRADVVMTARGLVGQVTEVGNRTSQAMLLTDQLSGVGAVVQRSRVSGICRGKLTPNLVMDYIEKDDDIKVGDIVVTSGTGGVYPKGIVIGRVTKVTPSSGLMKSASITPSVKLKRVEEVFVLVNNRSAE